MIRLSMLQSGESLIEEGRACSEAWSDIVQNLMAEGLHEEEVATLLRQRETWIAEAREMKSEGHPYDEIIFHLSTLKATWADIARALMEVGLSPADMLRAVLPCTEGEEYWSVVQAALLDGPEDADYGEVRGVLGFLFVREDEILETLDLNGMQRELVGQRLGLQQ